MLHVYYKTKNYRFLGLFRYFFNICREFASEFDPLRPQQTHLVHQVVSIILHRQLIQLSQPFVVILLSAEVAHRLEIRRQREIQSQIFVAL